MVARVQIAETGALFDAPEGDDLLKVLQRNHVPIATSCGGVASCGLCRITVVAGKEALTSIRSEELTHLGNVAKVIGTRLACQSRVLGEGTIVISVPEVEDVEERRRRKSLRLRAERRGTSIPPPASASADSDAQLDASHERAKRPQEVIEWRPRLRLKGER